MSGSGKSPGLFGRLFGRKSPAADPSSTSVVAAAEAEPQQGAVAAPHVASADAAAESAEPVSWLLRLRSGLSRTSSKLSEGIAHVFVRRKLEAGTLDELEDLLIQADLGIETAARVTRQLKAGRFDKAISPEEVREVLATEVERVLHPGLPGSVGHAIWKRDFAGATGLFSVVLKPASRAQLAAMLDGLELFGMGWSWGGYESLIVPFDPVGYRTIAPFTHEGPALRLHIGLEDTADLQADLAAGFERMRVLG